MKMEKKLTLGNIEVRSFIPSEKLKKIVGGHYSEFHSCTGINCGSANPC